MKCPRCQTTKSKYFQKVSNRYYCRRCIMFGRVFLDEKLETKEISYPNRCIDYHLDYSLSQQQKEVATSLVNNYKQGKNAVVLAVCGSGKTEIIYDSIKTVLNEGKRVCLAIPRKSLVIELATRIQKQFINITPELFYGGHAGNIDGQLIICTTHQLYRFHRQFSLLILDETDAFPYYKDELLEDMLFQSIKGQFIFMSATLTRDDFNDVSFYVLNRRYHHVDLPVPKIKFLPQICWIGYIKKYLRHCLKPVLIFVPRIKDFKIFQSNFTSSKFECISSKTLNSEKIIEKLKRKELDFIVTTTILERGITIEDVQVIVYDASHGVFNTETLIQIAGRVGRSPKFPTGEVIYLSNQKSKAMKKSIARIVHLNKMSV